MSLYNFPLELILLVAENLERPRDINALLKTSRRFVHLLTPLLHKAAVQNRMPALVWASKHGHELLVKLLLEQGCDINVKSEFYNLTSLHEAIMYGHEAIARLLIENGIDIKVVGAWGYGTALHQAAENGLDAVVLLLLENGADTEVDDGVFGGTALKRAAENGQETVAKLLLDWGAEVNAKDKNGWTPLATAVVMRKDGVVRLLLEHGADSEDEMIANDGNVLDAEA